MTIEKCPEIVLSIQTGSFRTNYHDWGKGSPVLLIHGLGPGVSAWANWGKVLPGHWTQVEHTARFVQLVENFLAE